MDFIVLLVLMDGKNRIAEIKRWLVETYNGIDQKDIDEAESAFTTWQTYMDSVRTDVDSKIRESRMYDMLQKLVSMYFGENVCKDIMQCTTFFYTNADLQKRYNGSDCTWHDLTERVTHDAVGYGKLIR